MKDSAKTRSTKKSKLGKQALPAVKTGNGGKQKRLAKVLPVIDEATSPKKQTLTTERVKLVRDSFTMPVEDFDLIADLKSRALEFKRPTKKSELLRAGLQQLAALDEVHLRAALAALRPLPTGRPKKAR